MIDWSLEKGHLTTSNIPFGIEHREKQLEHATLTQIPEVQENQEAAKPDNNKIIEDAAMPSAKNAHGFDDINQIN